jgi:pilus assembly protein CpaC
LYAAPTADQLDTFWRHIKEALREPVKHGIFSKNETEHVIIVTPYIVKSASLDELQTPSDGYAPASDTAALLLGRMNRMVKPGSKGLPKGRYRAPIGHIVN